MLEAACWAHVRRKFVDLHELHRSPVAAQAIERIGALYAVEQKIRGRRPSERRAVRQEFSRPLLDAMKGWLEQTIQTLSQKSAAAKASRYVLTRWEALGRYCDDGRVEIDNNAAERALRCVALGRKNYLFAGDDTGGERAAAIYSLVGRAKLNGQSRSVCARCSLASPNIRSHVTPASTNYCLAFATVRETLGHASLTTTGRYLHARPEKSSGDYLASDHKREEKRAQSQALWQAVQ